MYFYFLLNKLFLAAFIFLYELKNSFILSFFEHFARSDFPFFLVHVMSLDEPHQLLLNAFWARHCFTNTELSEVFSRICTQHECT
jgi:hypothetical protein